MYLSETLFHCQCFDRNLSPLSVKDGDCPSRQRGYRYRPFLFLQQDRKPSKVFWNPDLKSVGCRGDSTGAV